MKKIALFTFIVFLSLTSCKKKSSCICKDPTGKIVYNEVLETRSKLEKKHFDENCLKRESTYYVIGTGTTATTETTIPCVIS